MEYMDGNIRYDSIRRHAHYYNTVLDTRLKPDMVADAGEVIDHYKDCMKKPTVALLARKQKETRNYPEYRFRNESIFNHSSEVKPYLDSFEKTFNKDLYPKTKKARKFLIDKEFVVLDYIKPRVKSFSKTLFKLLGI